MSKTFVLRHLAGAYFLTQEVPQASSLLVELKDHSRPVSFPDGNAVFLSDFKIRFSLCGRPCRDPLSFEIVNPVLKLGDTLYLFSSNWERQFFSTLFAFVQSFVTSGDAFSVELTSVGEKSGRATDEVCRTIANFPSDPHRPLQLRSV
jgi:hypothetical protein